MEQLTDRLAGDVEELEGVVGVVGQEPPCHRVVVGLGCAVVEAGLLAVVGGVDEPHEEAGRHREAGPQVHRRRGGHGRRGSGGRGGEVAGDLQGAEPSGEVEDAPEGVDDAQLGEPGGAGPQERRLARRRRIGVRGAGIDEGRVVLPPGQLVLEAVEAGRRQVRGAGDGDQRGEVGGVLRAQDATAFLVELGLVVEEPVDGVRQRARPGRAEQRPARDRQRRDRGGVGAGLEIDLVEVPRRLDGVGDPDGHLPLDVHRHPRLRPVPQGDRRRGDAVAPAVVEQRPRLADAGHHQVGQRLLRLDDLRRPLGLHHGSSERLGDGVDDGGGVEERRLLHEGVGLPGQAAVAQRGDHRRTGQHGLVAADDLGRRAHQQFAGSVEAAVITMAQRPSDALELHDGIGRPEEPREWSRHGAELLGHGELANAAAGLGGADPISGRGDDVLDPHVLLRDDRVERPVSDPGDAEPLQAGHPADVASGSRQQFGGDPGAVPEVEQPGRCAGGGERRDHLDG